MERRRHRSPLEVDVHPKSGFGEGMSPIELEVLTETVPLAVGQDPGHHGLDGLGPERFPPRHRAQVAILPHERRSSGHEMEVGAPLGDDFP